MTTTPQVEVLPEIAPGSSSSPFNERLVAANICTRLRKGDIRVGLGLLDRYRHRVEEAIVLYETTDETYLAQVVIDDFREEARQEFGNLPQVSTLPAGYLIEEEEPEAEPMSPARLRQLVEDSRRGTYELEAA